MGKAMALGFARAGADVFLCSRHEDQLKAAADEIRGQADSRVEYATADLTRRDEVRQLAETAVGRLGTPG